MRRRGEEGFTLLEVMAAVAVLAVTLVTLLQAQARSIRASHDVQLKSQATLLAQEKMTELELRQAEGALNAGEEGGEFADVPPYRWETRVEDREELQGLPVIFRQATVRVLWPVGQDEKGAPVSRVYELTQFYPRLSGNLPDLQQPPQGTP